MFGVFDVLIHPKNAAVNQRRRLTLVRLRPRSQPTGARITVGFSNTLWLQACHLILILSVWQGYHVQICLPLAAADEYSL